MYKIVHGLAAAPTDILVKSDSRTRSNHDFKFKHIPARTSTYKNSFYPRTIPQWNALPAEAVAAPAASRSEHLTADAHE